MAFGHDSTTNRASAEPTHFKKLCQAEKTPTPGRQYVSSASAVTSQLGPSARPALPLRFRIRQYMRHNCPHNPKDMKANAQVLTNLVLLERILKQVPCDTVLLSRRVCRAWQDTIIGSFRLQQSLFLEPCGPLLSPFGNPDEADHRTIAPDSFRWATTSTSSMACAIVENPLMSKIFPLRDEQGRDGEGDSKVPTRAQWDAINRPDASWRKMFPSQPPVAALNWYHDSETSREHSKFGPQLPMGRGYIFDHGRFDTRRIFNKSGLTLEDIARKCLTICCPVGFDFRLFLQSIQTWRRPSAELITGASLPHLIKKYLYKWQQHRTRNMLSYVDGRYLHIYEDSPWSESQLESLWKHQEPRRQLDARVRKAGAQGGRGLAEGSRHELRHISTSGGGRSWISGEFEN